MTSSLHTAMTTLAAQIAAAPAFSARVANSTYFPDDATKHVYHDEVLITTEAAYDTEMDDKRPFAVIVETEHAYERASGGVSVGMVGGGSLIVEFSDGVPGTEDPNDTSASKLDFADWVGSVLDWIAENNGVGDYLVEWSGIRLIQAVTRTPLEERQAAYDFYSAVYEFRYGAETQ